MCWHTADSLIVCLEIKLKKNYVRFGKNDLCLEIKLKENYVRLGKNDLSTFYNTQYLVLARRFRDIFFKFI